MGKSASLKEIETYLHPCPKVNGLDILHRHQGQYVYFDAWDGDDKKNTKFMQTHRQDVLVFKENFYKVKADDIEWLTQED